MFCTGQIDWDTIHKSLQEPGGAIDAIIEELEKAPQRSHKGEIFYLPQFMLKDEHKPVLLGMILEMIISRIEDNTRNIHIRCCSIDDMDILHIFYRV